MARCPRCRRDDADVDVTQEGSVSFAIIECRCWPEPFEAEHDRRRHEPGECDLFVPRYEVPQPVTSLEPGLTQC